MTETRCAVRNNGSASGVFVNAMVDEQCALNEGHAGSHRSYRAENDRLAADNARLRVALDNAIREIAGLAEPSAPEWYDQPSANAWESGFVRAKTYCLDLAERARSLK